MKAVQHDVYENEDGTLHICGRCPLSGKDWEMTVDAIPYDSWVAGEILIQVAFPDMNPAYREQLMTGITPEAWDATFSVGEDTAEMVNCPFCQKVEYDASEGDCPECGKSVYDGGEN